MYKILLFFISILVAGCVSIPLHNKKIQDEICLLTNDSVKYWYDAWKIPYFPDYTEGGIALSKNGDLINYQLNYENVRVITNNLSEDVICDPPKYYVKSNKFYILDCGTKFIFKIVKLNKDTLYLKGLKNYESFPDSIPLIFLKSKDQVTRSVKGDLINPDPNARPVKAMPVIK